MTTRSFSRYSCDVVGAGRGERPEALARGRQTGRDGAEEGEGRPSNEVRRRPREPARRACCRARRRRAPSWPARTTRPRADDVPHVDRRRASTGPSCSTRLIAWANALARTGFPSLNRKPRRSLNVYVFRSSETFQLGDLGLQPEPGRRLLVRVREEPRAGRVEERPARLRERERRVDGVEPGGRREADAKDPAFLPASARAGLCEDGAADQTGDEHGSEPASSHDSGR